MVDKVDPVVIIEEMSSKKLRRHKILLARPPSPGLWMNRSYRPSRAEDAQPQDCPPKLDSNPLPTVQDGIPNQSDIYIGNVKLQTEYVDTIAGAFLQSSRKTLHFVPPTRQNGEIVIRPTKEVVDNGSKKWRSTAVGYFLGKRPYFPQVETFVRSNWKGLQHVSVSSSGFFFFRFFSQLAMEDVIEGGPWLVQGQPIVLQPWEQGMSLRRQKHTQIPVWIRLRHLPMEYWTDDGLSTVASGIGTPLYTDGITKDCSRLDFARVCVMLDFNSELPKHLVVISPVLRNGKEDPKRIDVEYEWLPQRCKNCCSLGHVSATCPANRIKTVAPPIQIFVKKQAPQLDSGKPEQSLRDSPKDAERIMDEDNHTMGPNDSSPMAHVQRTRRHLLNNWSWFEDYSGPAGRIWVTWDPLEVDIEILEDGPQHIHCRALNKRLHTSEGSRSLWKRLDRMLANVAWLDIWPSSSYISALPSTSDHSPLILTGTAMYDVVCKLKNLKAVFRRQKKLTGDLANNVKRAKIFLDKAQALFDKHKEDIFLHLVKCCRQVYATTVKLEVNMLQQRAKLRWLKHGDQSSKFFFRKINSTRMKQRIFQITKASGEILTAQHDVIQEFTLLSELTWRFQQSQDSGLEVNMPTFVSDYRPIACCNTLYKAITKILVKRLQRVLPLMIDHSQNAFVPGRSISDNILLAQELLAGYNQARLPARCMLKVDIQKAYDSVEWDFLLETLRLFNFPQQFIILIKQCVSTASFSISLNGSIYGFFKSSRGLRQGDPISPYLFVLVMEVWSTLIRHRVQQATQFSTIGNAKNLAS
ncbi:UNVERIFIED_CONTAM: hypothetical protein Scaly_2976400 [Sesamum calycinum]|uniref:Reverse transcriptase domain-containing protein n=1 Tax=Sesamum calycinum TaxID=2727403 RepID=A0AAW2KMB4_9LAMI